MNRVAACNPSGRHSLCPYVLDVAEAQRWGQFGGAAHHECGRGEEDGIAIHIVSHRAAVLSDEFLYRPTVIR
jgi:hypothetical protein